MAGIEMTSTVFLHAIRACFAASGGFALEELRTRPWSSRNFRGSRHELAFRLEGAAANQAADRFLAEMHRSAPELPGQILASLSLLAEERRPGCARIRIEALTVEPG
ncbi:MAG TPA: hypothetical protein VEZ70_04590 [Allosphingosinicella sp.]|nr:hypothetical protein [Allosphingosinicella sp.]